MISKIRITKKTKKSGCYDQTELETELFRKCYNDILNKKNRWHSP